MSDRQAWLASLSEEEFERLQRVVQPPRYGRRDVLKAGGVAAAAAALGAGATGAAMGDASTSDSDGDIGQPGNRVDVFADGVDSDSVTAEQLDNDSGTEPTIPWIRQNMAPSVPPMTQVYETLSFNGEIDPIHRYGYNVAGGGSRIDTSEHALAMSLEGNYYNGTGHKAELNLDRTSSGGTNQRDLAYQFDDDTGESYWVFGFDSTVNFAHGGVNGTSQLRATPAGAEVPDDRDMGIGTNRKYYMLYNSSTNKFQFRSNAGPDPIADIEDASSRWAWWIDVDLQNDQSIQRANTVQYNPQDVRNLSSPAQGWTAYHDGSGGNTEGPAHYNGTNWISTVDGSTIS